MKQIHALSPAVNTILYMKAAESYSYSQNNDLLRKTQ